MHSMFTASTHPVPYCSNSMNIMDSLQVGGRKALWIKLGLAPILKIRATFNRAFDIPPYEVLMAEVGLQKNDATSVLALSSRTCRTLGPDGESNRIWLFAILYVLFFELFLVWKDVTPPSPYRVYWTSFLRHVWCTMTGWTFGWIKGSCPLDFCF